MRTSLLVLTLLPVLAFGQNYAEGRPIRIAVHHADPWAIKTMMEGRPLASPELSAILLRLGGAGMAGTAAAASNLLMGGRLFVNPTDNSLWWAPKDATAQGG